MMFEGDRLPKVVDDDPLLRIAEMAEAANFEFSVHDVSEQS
jgi:hypothetical protein